MSNTIPYRDMVIVNDKYDTTPRLSWWQRLKTWWKTPSSKISYFAEGGEVSFLIETSQLNHRFSLTIEELIQFNSWLQKQPDNKDCMIVGASKRVNAFVPWFAVPKLKKVMQDLVETYERTTELEKTIK